MQCAMDDVSVNVCDICGEIGDEEKLAICSRCNDGAEHTYCMQVMIEDVPEGAWFCEECRAEEDIEEKHKNLEKSQVKIGIVSSKNKAGIERVAVTNGRIKKQSELKHCGICGDVGEQEKLAICSRCNDGAEHIYCMGVMLEEVPDVGWLCEGCQSEVAYLAKCQYRKRKACPSLQPYATSLAPKAPKAQLDHGQLLKSVSFNNSKFPRVKQLTLATSATLKNSNFGDSVPMAKTPMKIPAKETRVMNQLGSQNVRNNRGSSIASSSVSASMVAPVASQSESSGQYELKKPVLVKEPGSITLSSGKRSAGFLGLDPKGEAVQVLHHSHEEYNTNCPILKVEGYEAAYMVGRSLDSPTMSSDLGDKKLVSYSQDTSPGYGKIASAIPEMDYFWQGSFELWGTGTLPQFCDGLQGHISCSASPELFDVAKKFPSKIHLQQLPRQNVWPSEFQETYPICDSIDIFFFAKDIQSYENYYSKLVESIAKDDLALKGNIETAELIIFSSGTLPEKFETWNMLYFLWGVLRVKREDLLNLPPALPDKHY